MSNSKVHSTFDSLYDKVKGDNDDFIEEEVFQNFVDELVEIGYMETSMLEDDVLYSAKPGLKWADIVDIDHSIKKNILLLLIENPTTFFVLLNTQKGKMRINALEVKKWGEDKNNRVVAFMPVSNDTTLADQSAESVSNTIGELNIDLIKLSSNSKTTFEEIKRTIDAYEANPDDYQMPVIVLLANNKQIEKMIKLIQHIDKKIKSRNSRLRYGIIWDEADQIYPQFRNKPFHINGETVSIKKYIIDDNAGLYRLGFTTASEGDLLEEEYPECANAYLYPVVIDPADTQHYRALHHPEAITHLVPFARHTNNSYAKEIISKNIPHFTSQYILPSGEVYHKKIIVNSNAKTSDMIEFAKWCNQQGMYALVFNGFSGTSVKIYIDGRLRETFKTRGQKFNEVLFYAYKKLGLNDKPLVIIGRRKVDRGLGFHYCPRTNVENCIEGKYGNLITQNREGLVWTDMILGKIDDKNIATQKAGRLAGIIGNSPQYQGSIQYWTDEHTEDLVRRHNNVVDVANTYTGCSVLQAVKHAEDTTPKRKVNHRVDLNKFLVYKDEETVREVCRILGYRYTPGKLNGDGFIHTSINQVSDKVSLLEAINKVEGAYGAQEKDKEREDITQRPNKYVKIKKGDEKDKIGQLVEKVENNKYSVKINDGELIHLNRSDFSLISYRTFLPCYKNKDDPSSLHYVVIIRQGDEHKLQEIRSNHTPINIPQEGDFEI
jgi:hypothetical protein